MTFYWLVFNQEAIVHDSSKNHTPILWYMLHIEGQNTYLICKVRIFLSGSHSFNGLFEGSGLVLRLRLEVGLG